MAEHNKIYSIKEKLNGLDQNNRDNPSKTLNTQNNKDYPSKQQFNALDQNKGNPSKVLIQQNKSNYR